MRSLCASTKTGRPDDATGCAANSFEQQRHPQQPTRTVPNLTQQTGHNSRGFRRRSRCANGSEHLTLSICRVLCANPDDDGVKVFLGLLADSEDASVGSQASPGAGTRSWDYADRVATEFEESLKRSERPSIRTELDRVGPDARGRLLAELVGLEIVYRRRKGESVSLSDYESDFPEMSDLTPEERAEMDDWVERSTPRGTPAVPAQIGCYPIVASLGRGGQAEAFRAIHPGFQATVVLKLAHQPADPALIDRIATERRLLASLPAHRHLVKVHDVDLHEGRVFLVAYPDVEKSRDLKRPAGTELFLALSGPDLPAPEEVERLWNTEGGGAPMPTLPATTVARLTAGGVNFEGEQSRDLGEFHDRSDPQERLRQRLESFRKSLGRKCALIEGVAFAHE